MQIYSFVAAMPGAAVLAIMVPVNAHGTYDGGRCYYVGRNTRSMFTVTPVADVRDHVNAAVVTMQRHGCDGN